jgi:hypothetical protein
MVDSIKITALQDIGANIAYTTLVPVVNMSGTPTTQKSNLQNLGNLILNGAGGSYFARAAQANIALSVSNPAQPNITSVGTLASLTVTGNANIGNIGATQGVFTSISGSLVSASQPNVTSLGTLTSLTVTGNVGANYTISSVSKTTPVVVASLPAAATAGAGARAFVTDATSTTFNAAVVGGGSNNMPVFSNGTGWFIG